MHIKAMGKGTSVRMRGGLTHNDQSAMRIHQPSRSEEATHLSQAENSPLKNANQTKNEGNMSNQTQAIRDDMSQLADDARALMTATADVAGVKVGEARDRLAAALERAKEMCVNVREKAVEGAKVADEAVHAHPYQAIAVGVGVGALLGYLIARRCCRNGE